MYNSIGSKIIGSSVGVFLRVSIGYGVVWEACIPVGMVPEGGGDMVSLSDSNDDKGRL